jgi:hypothetical protein
MESIGFKEWAAICTAMELGRQSIILRKGGIAEGRDGFSFKHPEFFLFPTWFHEQPAKVRDSGLIPTGARSDIVEIRLLVRVDVSAAITSWPIVEALEPFHVLQSEVIRERFSYDEAPGLRVAFLRVFRVFPSWTFPNEKSYGGCRSWVGLPAPPANQKLEPVVTDAEHDQRKREFSKIVSGL